MLRLNIFRHMRYTIIMVVMAMIIYAGLWSSYMVIPRSRISSINLKILSFGNFAKNLNSTLGFDHIYVINSLNQTDRREKMKDVARRLGLEFEFFPAFSPDNKQVLTKLNPSSKLEPSHEAYFINHFKVYQSIAHHGYKNALILDDNLDFESNITSIMSNVHRILPADWELLYLSYCNGQEDILSNSLPHNNGPSVFKLFKSKKSYCAHAYAVSSSGAIKLFQKLTPTTLPLDFELVNMIQSGQISSYTIVPPPIVQWRAPGKENYRLHSLKNSTINLLTNKSKPLNSTLGFDRIYVTNVSNRPGRREKLEAIASKLNLNFYFFPEVSQFDREALELNLGDESQRAHYINHYKIYQSIAYHKYDSVLILEDDVDLELNIKSIMTDTHRILPADWEILYLGHCSDLEGKSDNKDSSSAYKLFRSKKPYCTYAYAVSHIGVLKILQNLSKQTKSPIDLELVHMVERGVLISYTLIPPVVSRWHISDNPSNIYIYPGKKTFDLFQLKNSTLYSLGLNHESNSTLGFGHIYVINLLSRPDRRKKLEIVANRFNLNFEYLSAVPKDDTNAFNGFGGVWGVMTPPQKACYVSHYKAYKLMALRGYDSVLILEDDVDFELNVASIMANAHRILPSNWELFYPGFCSNIEGQGNPLPDHNNILPGYQIFKSNMPYCTHAYAVSRAAVSKLIKRLKYPKGAPIDIELIDLINEGLFTSYTLVPPIISQWRSLDNPSDVSPNDKVNDFYFLKHSALNFLGGIKESANNTLGFDHIFVINDQDHSDRREKFDTIATRLFLEVEYFTAGPQIDMKNFDKLEIRYMWLEKFATWINHYGIYRSIVDRGYGSALILGDNVDIELNITSIMSDVHRILPPDWEILYLGHCNDSEGRSGNPIQDINHLSDYKLFKSEKPNCTYAYAVSRAGARKILKRLSYPTALTIDLELINMIQLGQITSYTLIPPIIVRWKSYRRDSDFYTLKNSTVEFLGA